MDVTRYNTMKQRCCPIQYVRMSIEDTNKIFELGNKYRCEYFSNINRCEYRNCSENVLIESILPICKKHIGRYIATLHDKTHTLVEDNQESSDRKNNMMKRLVSIRAENHFLNGKNINVENENRDLKDENVYLKTILSELTEKLKFSNNKLKTVMDFYLKFQDSIKSSTNTKKRKKMQI